MPAAMIDADFGAIDFPIATEHDLIEPSAGFERVAYAANQAMIDVLREDWTLANYGQLEAA